MGRHGDDDRRRGIAGWLLYGTIAGVVVVALVVGWFVWLGTDSGSGTVDTGCTGDVRVEVAAGGSAAAIQLVADGFNASHPEARGSCLTAEVSTLPSVQTAAGLTAGWAAQATPAPAVWIPDNPGDLADVAAAMPSLVAGYNDTVIAASPVVLAVSAKQAANFPASFNWVDIGAAAAAGNPLPLVDGSPLKLALGDPRQDRSSGYALESILAPGAAPLSTTDVTAATDELAALTTWSALSDSTTGLLDDLATGSASFNAIPVLEYELAAFNRDHDDPLTAVYPAGPTAGDQLTAVGLSASWLDTTQIEGAASFLDYLSSPAGVAALSQAGFRTPDSATGTATPTVAPSVPPTAADGVDPANAVTTLPAAGSAVLAQLAAAMQLPSAAPSTAPSTGSSAAPSAASEPSTDSSTSDTAPTG